MKTTTIKTLRLAVLGILVLSMMLSVMPAMALPGAQADVTDLPWMNVNVRIANGTGNLVIEGNSGTTAVGGNIDIWTYWADSTYYQWRLIPDANHEYVQLRRYTTSLAATALAPTGGTVAAGTRLTLATASDTADNQWWKPELQANGRYLFSSKADSNLIIQPISAASGQGIRLATRPNTIATSDTWRILNNPAGTVLEVVKPIQMLATQLAYTVPINTPISSISLPAAIMVTYVDNTEAMRAVTWDTTSYNGAVAGKYMLSGTVALDGMETNPGNLRALIEVTVEGAAGPSVTITKAPSYTDYAIYDQLDLRGIEVKVDNGAGATTVYGNADIALLLTKVTMDYDLNNANGLTSAAAGAQQTANRTVTLTFDEGSASFPITVSRYAFDSGQRLAIVTAPENPAGNGGNAEMRNFDSTFHSTFGAKTAILGADGKFIANASWTYTASPGHPIYTVNRNTSSTSYFGYSVRPANNGYLYLNNVQSSYYTSPTNLTNGANYIWKFIRLANGRYAFVYMGNTNNYNLAMAQTNNMGNGNTTRAYATFVEFNPATTNQWYDIVAEYTPEGGEDTYTISASPLTSFGSVTGTPYTQPAAQTVTITNTGTGSVSLGQPTATNYDIGALSTNILDPAATATFTVQPKAGLAVGSYNETITITGWGGVAMIQIGATVNASFTINSGTLLNQPVIKEARLVTSNFIELNWEGDRYINNAGASKEGTSAVHTGNFEVRLNGTVRAQSSPWYWCIKTMTLHGVVVNQNKTTLRLSTALSTSEMAAVESGASTLTVRITNGTSNVTSSAVTGNTPLTGAITAANRGPAGDPADTTTVYPVVYKPYYEKQVRSEKAGVLMKGSEYVADGTMKRAGDMVDVILSVIPNPVLVRMQSVSSFCIFGPGEHSYNIPEHRSIFLSDAWNRAEGYGGNTSATSAANVERNHIAQAPYYPTTYRSGYADESILSHEFGHGVHSALQAVATAANPEMQTLNSELNSAYASVKARRTSATNTPWTDYVTSPNAPSEYIATLTAIWYNAMGNSNSASVNTRAKMFVYDRKAYDVFAKMYSQDNIALSSNWIIAPITQQYNQAWVDSAPMANPATRAIMAVAPQAGISVPVGTAISGITLPEKVQLAYTNSFAAGYVIPWAESPYGLERLPVNWDTTAYNGDVPGVYNIEGTIHATYQGLLTNVIVNPNNIKAIIAITVEALSTAELASIAITTPPTKTVYAAGDALDLSGLVVTATYSDDETKAVTGYTTVPAAGAALDTVGTQTVTVSYTEGGITKTATFNVTVGLIPVIKEARLVTSNFIELNWEGDRYINNAGASKEGTSAVHTGNFEVRLNGTVRAQSSPWYWCIKNMTLHGVVGNQNKTTLRLSTALSASEMAAVESGASTLTVRITNGTSNVTSSAVTGNTPLTGAITAANRGPAGPPADTTVVYPVVYKPYYEKQVRSEKAGILMKGSEYVADGTMKRAGDMVDVILSVIPNPVLVRMQSASSFCIFGPGEHSYNIPEHRSIFLSDAWNRAEGYGGNTSATSAANVERNHIAQVPYYPTTYRSGYSDESILSHEFGHGVHSALQNVATAANPEMQTLNSELNSAYASVRARRTSATNTPWTDYVTSPSGPSEYIATLTAIWYNAMGNSNSASVNTRAKMFVYDRKAYDVFAKMYSQDNTALSSNWIIAPITQQYNQNWVDSAPFANPATRAIMAVAPQAGITVPVGTAISGITLPEKVQLAYTNSFAAGYVIPWAESPYGLERLPVNWDTTAYNGDVPGIYNIEGAVHATYQGLLTNVITNPNNVKAIIAVTVEGPEAAELTGIAITTPPTKTVYAAGETLDLSGLVVTATYSDDETAAVTGFTTVPAAGAALDTVGTQTVTVSYTEGDITKTATFNVTVGVIPVIKEARLVTSNFIELNWEGDRYINNAGASKEGTSAVHTGNFEVRLNGTVRAQSSPWYWCIKNMTLHGVVGNQNKTTLRLSTALSASEMAAIESGDSTLTVRITNGTSNVTSSAVTGNTPLSGAITAANRGPAGPPADTTVVYPVVYKPYYEKQVRSEKAGILMKGSEYVADGTMKRAGDMVDVILSVIPNPVLVRMQSVSSFCIFGPGEHSYNIPEHRSIFLSDAWNRAEGYGGNTSATSAANVERNHIAQVPYYPTTYRSGYSDESILSHEFGHGVHSALQNVATAANPEMQTLNSELNSAYASVRARRTSATNTPWTDYVTSPSGPSEYIATLTAIWYNAMGNSNSASVNTRAKMFVYDRKAYDVFAKMYSQDNTALSSNWIINPITQQYNQNWVDSAPFANPATRAIMAVAPQAEVTVPFGTDISGIILPEKVQLAYANSFAAGYVIPWAESPYGLERLPVNWDTSAYNGNVAGTYDIVGTVHATYQGLLTNVIVNPNDVKAIITVTVEPNDNFTVYLEAAQTEYSMDETIYVDVMLKGDMNYTQVSAAITYDTSVLAFAGYENLGGLIGELKQNSADNIVVRSVPTMNMFTGASCEEPVTVVTLKFTVIEGLDVESIDTQLAFDAIAVFPVAIAAGATTAPGNTLNIHIE